MGCHLEYLFFQNHKLSVPNCFYDEFSSDNLMLVRKSERIVGYAGNFNREECALKCQPVRRSRFLNGGHEDVHRIVGMARRNTRLLAKALFIPLRKLVIPRWSFGRGIYDSLKCARK